jgi:hypothetical protein
MLLACGRLSATKQLLSEGERYLMTFVFVMPLSEQVRCACSEW